MLAALEQDLAALPWECAFREAETVGRHVREREERSEAERMRSDLREMERTGEGRRG